MGRSGNGFILWLDEIGADEVDLVGGKNASLGEMYRNLTPLGIRVPPAFVVSTPAYQRFLQSNGLEELLHESLKRVASDDLQALREVAVQIRNRIIGAELPEDLQAGIAEGYDKLCAMFGQVTDVAVRSSASAEDLPVASFAGQQDTFLNVRGTEAVVAAVKRCYASLYNERAISYRMDHGFEPASVLMSVGVQKMVRSDRGASGVMFTLETETGFPDVILINSVFGLGEMIVQGAVNPDEFVVFKPTLRLGYEAIVSRRLGEKKLKMVYGIHENEAATRVVRTSVAERNRFSLSDEEALRLARWALIIEEHYSHRNRRWTPMDIEWAKDGLTGALYTLQARPETVQARKDPRMMETYRMKNTGKELARGLAIGAKIGSGQVNVLEEPGEITRFKRGQVLVTDMTDPDWEPIMKMASAIVTNRGGRTCHAAIVSRELGIPAVVGTGNGTDVIPAGSDATVACCFGETGIVFEGQLPFEREVTDLSALAMPKTRLMMNLGNPDLAFRLAGYPHQGVGLAREEFIIASSIGIHPMALLGFPEIQDPALKAEIEARTSGYADKKEFYVERLAQGIGRIAAAMYPRDVIVRFSDFKSNEYSNLLGGKLFEPSEENPMLGWRGASRYYAPGFEAAFGLECQAIRRVRSEMGLINLKLMVPFCRTPEEGRRVLDVMSRYGLKRGVEGLEVYVMAELPSNILLAEEFAEIFDGFSIGSNDLTQLTLGVDRDSYLVSHLYDERNAAVLEMIQRLIQVAKGKGKKVGICGQAPSDFPEFLERLVEWGIDSISLNPDTVLPALQRVVALEEARSGAESMVSEVV
jgi:pyruvate,water dikinase